MTFSKIIDKGPEADPLDNAFNCNLPSAVHGYLGCNIPWVIRSKTDNTIVLQQFSYWLVQDYPE